ncbi:MAG TPA: RcpC/CpaB family pilus assembly protein [Bacillus sp. (in: firmicutes)]|nr:RcpC/CpaB family pilus assembly protein [Bacillus sp. (in: firmicutes)]
MKKKKKLSSLTKKRLIAGSAALLGVMGVYQYTEVTIQNNLKPTKAYFAAQDIPPHTKITEDMIFEIPDVPADGLPPNVFMKKEDIIGKWTVEGYGVTKNSPFYKGKIVKTNEMPDAAILNLNPDESAFPLLVDLETSSGNAIIPGAYVDLYFVTDSTVDRKPLSGLLFERVRVTSVKDSQTRNVFGSEDYTEKKSEEKNTGVASSTNNSNAVAKLYTLAVSKEQLQLLNQAKILGNLVPVANGLSYEKETGETMKGSTSNSALITWIKANSYDGVSVPANKATGNESTNIVSSDSALKEKPNIAEVEEEEHGQSTVVTEEEPSKGFAGPVLTTESDKTTNR